jgi:hypothetical protein
MKELDLAKKQILQETIAATLDILLSNDFDSAEEHIRTARMIYERNQRITYNHPLQFDEACV